MKEDIKSFADMAWESAKLAIASEEFLPAAVVLKPGGEAGVFPFTFRNSREKLAMISVLSDMVRIVDAEASIIIIEAWMLNWTSSKLKKAIDPVLLAKKKYNELLDQFGGSLKNVPGRMDTLMLLCVDRFGEKYVKAGEVKTRSSKKGRKIWVDDKSLEWMEDPSVLDTFVGDMVLKAWATSKGETVQ